ncbi:hypothetical protein [Trichococcus collinsii]|uniref:Peptidase m50 n=1 Tax=Trichococcus collinsii TaxID=157076 RepID=A0AB37ZVS1_9LACT|nr:hypothetical protein [Trichococcus collinsii]CZQ85565.1 Hypothetical protein Tcol_515 [Trichococcus collinsii]SDZ78884.1 hypothetical protein SAMN04488525_101163 [Trichococcus collinsii]
MKKSFLRIASHITIAFIMFYGYLIAKGFNDWGNLSSFDPLLVPALSAGLFLSIHVHVFLHEGGHFLFGKLSGYQLVSFQVRRYKYSQADHSLHHMQAASPLLAGQCLMAPPEGDYAELPYRSYLLGGIMANALTGTILYCLAFLMELKTGSLFVLFSLVPVWMTLANLLPKAQNDGALLREASRSLPARRLLFQQLEMAQLIEEKVPFADLPDAYFESIHDAQYQKTFLVDYFYMVAYVRALGELDFEEADSLLQTFSANRPVEESVYWPVYMMESLFCDALFGRLANAEEKYIQIQAHPLLKRYWIANNRIRAAYAFFCLTDIAETKKLLGRGPATAQDSSKEMETSIELRLYRWLNSYFEH